MQNKFMWPAVFVICSVIVASGIYLGLRDNQPEPYTQTYVDTPSEHATSSERLTPDVDKDDPIVYVTRTGECYHRGTCRYLSKSKIPMKLSIARQRYRPCSKCNPPQ